MSQAFPVKGILVPLVTPLSGRDRLDAGGLERLIEHVIAGGVHGIFLLGTTGEAPSLTDRLKRELVERSVALIRHRVPLLVGVTDTSFVDSLALAEIAGELGADAVVAAPPPYFPLNQSDLYRSMSELGEESPLPLYLYNMPSHSKVPFEFDTVRRLAEHPNVAGIKDSSGDMLAYNQLLQLAEQRPDFTVLMGPEELLAESVLMGGHGGVCGGANLHPRLYVELYEAAVSGDLNLVHRLQHRVLRLAGRLYSIGEPPSGYLPGLKCALAALELCDETLASPLQPLSDERREQVVQHLRDLGLIGADRRRA